MEITFPSANDLLFSYLLSLKTRLLDNAIQDFLLASPLWYMSQCTIIYKYVKCTRQLKIKGDLKKMVSLAIMVYELI